MEEMRVRGEERQGTVMHRHAEKGGDKHVFGQNRLTERTKNKVEGKK